MTDTEKYALSQLDSLAKKASEKNDYEILSAINTIIEQIKKLNDIKEIVNRQLIAGKNNYRETYECFHEIADVILR